jgi:DNA-binding response OmpR family regulator
MNVLLIAEDPALTDLLTLLLQPTRANIQLAHSDSEGIQTARSKWPDLIIVDSPAKIEKGWQVCRILRSACGAPIMILSAQDDPVEVAAALDAGADLFLTKPVSSKILLANIKNLFRRKSFSNGRNPSLVDQVSAR